MIDFGKREITLSIVVDIDKLKKLSFDTFLCDLYLKLLH